ncbi:TerB family tellurite resistance protein [Candidatus Pelagibacter sp.]|nr:TerB family tellurite resistance protein [Candidatus Pelagibacter sp.]
MFFKKDATKTEKSFLVKICALLIHAAKIDENYTEKEEEIIKKTLLELRAKKDTITEIIMDAKSIEENSNQILDFTKEVKNLPENDKIKIIETLWSIIYSNNEADIYETNLMRRLAGLLYIDSSTMADIKDKIKKKNYNDLYS